MERTIANVVVIVVLVALAGFVAMNGFYTLGVEEQAVIQRFGEVVEIVEEPGIHFKIPVIDRMTPIF